MAIAKFSYFIDFTEEYFCTGGYQPCICFFFLFVRFLDKSNTSIYMFPVTNCQTMNNGNNWSCYDQSQQRSGQASLPLSHKLINILSWGLVFLTPDWLFSCDTIIFRKYFWCSQFGWLNGNCLANSLSLKSFL